MKLVEFTRCYEHTCRLKIVLVTGTGANEKLVAEYLYRVDQKPVLGQYCLNIEPKSAEISAKTVEKCFDIEEYVLPTFESEISFDQGERHGSIRTNLTILPIWSFINTFQEPLSFRTWARLPDQWKQLTLTDSLLQRHISNWNVGWMKTTLFSTAPSL